jgi:hypothetical protein
MVTPLFSTHFFNYKEVVDMTNFDQKVRFNLALVSYENVRGSSKRTVKCWDSLRLDQVPRFDWYFRRVAALYQVQHPKRIYEFELFREVTQEEDLFRKIKREKDKLSALNGKITRLLKMKSEMERNWAELFPIESDLVYKGLIETMEKAKLKHVYLSDSLKSLTCP